MLGISWSLPNLRLGLYSLRLPNTDRAKVPYDGAKAA